MWFNEETELNGEQIKFDVNDTYDSFSVIYDDDPVLSAVKLKLVFELQS